MYSKGIDAAIVVGVLAAALPALWVAWWFIAALGERVNGNPTGRHTHHAA